MPKIAILHVPHEQCEASMAEMLSSVGYKVHGIDRDLSHVLNQHMKPVVSSRLFPKASLSEFARCDLFVTVKHYNLPSIYERHPHLKGRVLWFDINGGVPEEVIFREPKKTYPAKVPVPYVSANKRYTDDSIYKVSGPRYVCYIPLANREVFLKAAHVRKPTRSPVCIVHNPHHWGYGWVMDQLVKEHGVRFYGGWGAPAGRVEPKEIPGILTNALCMTHMKGRDCPGIALYEALLTGCPVIITDLFLQRTLYTDLYVHNETCYMVKDNVNMAIPQRADDLMVQLSDCIRRLKDPSENVRIGANGRKQIVKLMWQSSRKEDVESFRSFMEENFK